MKIWDIIKEDFEKNNSVEEGWKEKAIAAALGASVALGAKSLDKPIKDEPKKIEYTSTKSDLINKELSNLKLQYAKILKQNTPEFINFRNYYPTLDYLSSFDIYTVDGKMAIIDSENQKDYIDLGEDINTQIKLIVKNKLVIALKRMKESNIVRIIKTT